MELKNLNSVLDRLNNDMANDINTEHICALRCALVDFLDDMERLYADANSDNPLYDMSKEDYNSIRQMIKMAGELYLNIR